VVNLAVGTKLIGCRRHFQKPGEIKHKSIEPEEVDPEQSSGSRVGIKKSMDLTPCVKITLTNSQYFGRCYSNQEVIQEDFAK